jgi:GTP-binding protein LepA
VKIRNFSIIAHIDHGKSTLADRMLEMTGTIETRQMRAQIMDSMELERERGITIKAKAVRMHYKGPDGEEYILNLIDTPGHVDFSYEVSRALAACEGAILVVDATQGVEAQTLANAHLALGLGLKLVPVINKVDLPSADEAGTEEQIQDYLHIYEEAIPCSAKEGVGVDDVLEAIVSRIPAPKGKAEQPLAALIFDSLYDTYRGVVLYVRVVDGTLKAKQKVRFFSTGNEITVDEVGYLTPKMEKGESLSAGEVGYIVTGLKDIHQVRVGDTIMESARPLSKPLPGYREARSVVFAGFFPINPADYENLKQALEKLNLEDSSFHYQQDSSEALGFGFRLGFLGLLHMDIVKERLEREFNLSLIATSPNVAYKVKTHKAETEVDNPAHFPDYGTITQVQEPVVAVTIVVPVAYMSPVVELLKDRRAEHSVVEHLAHQRVMLKYTMPLSEMVIDFYDKLKSVSKGYASFEYEPAGYQPAELVKMDILIHQNPVDALSLIVHKDKAYTKGKALCEKLKELIPRQQFEVAIQAKIGGKVIARETLSGVRKDVIAKCYGGDITRKRKLLEKQKEGKARMKQLGSVELPQEAFLAVLKITE